METTAQEFNERHPIGSKFNYEFIVGKSDPIPVVTTSEAWDCCGSVIVSVDCLSGGIDIDHLNQMRLGN